MWRCYKQGTSLEVSHLVENCKGVWRENLVGAVSTEAEQSQLLKAIAKEQLVKTQQTEKS
jgi:hypothetical protein